LTLLRIAELGSTESDAVVCRSLLSAVAREATEPATRLAYACLSHPTGDIRRLACEHLAKHPHAGHANMLVPALDDADVTVVRAAVRALGRQPALADSRPLENQLATKNKLLRIDVAESLARLNVPSGPEALLRLSGDNDLEIRRQVAVAMGALQDPRFAASLVRMLDDGLGVRHAALASLPRVAGHDVFTPGASPSLQERVDAWKRWHEREQVHATSTWR
jgi:hypothetical protein